MTARGKGKRLGSGWVQMELRRACCTIVSHTEVTERPPTRSSAFPLSVVRARALVLRSPVCFSQSTKPASHGTDRSISSLFLFSLWSASKCKFLCHRTASAVCCGRKDTDPSSSILSPHSPSPPLFPTLSFPSSVCSFFPYYSRVLATQFW